MLPLAPRQLEREKDPAIAPPAHASTAEESKPYNLSAEFIKKLQDSFLKLRQMDDDPASSIHKPTFVVRSLPKQPKSPLADTQVNEISSTSSILKSDDIAYIYEEIPDSPPRRKDCLDPSASDDSQPPACPLKNAKAPLILSSHSGRSLKPKACKLPVEVVAGCQVCVIS